MGHCGTVWTTVLTKVSDLSVVFVQEKQKCDYLAVNRSGTTEKTIQLLLEATFLVGGGEENSLYGLKVSFKLIKIISLHEFAQINQNTLTVVLYRPDNKVLM